MTVNGWLLIAVYAALLIAMAKPMGSWLFALYDGRALPGRVVEHGFYRLAGIDPDAEMSWRQYAIHVLIFSFAGVLLTYALLRVQGMLPLNPLGMKAVDPHLAMNTAISFITNTNWQSYSGESTMSNLTQMVALTVHNFLSAATGIAVAFAVVRGFAGVRRADSAISGPT